MVVVGNCNKNTQTSHTGRRNCSTAVFDRMPFSRASTGLWSASRLLAFVQAFLKQPSDFPLNRPLEDFELSMSHTVENTLTSNAPFCFGLDEGEQFFVCHDDIQVMCASERVSCAHTHNSWALSRTSLHHGITKLWKWCGWRPHRSE